MTQDQPQAQPGALLPCPFGCDGFLQLNPVDCVEGTVYHNATACPAHGYHRFDTWQRRPSAVPTEAPVAWINKDGTYVELSTKSTVYGSHTIPLYTRPSPATTVMGLTPEGYRLLNDGEVIEGSDQFYRPGTASWVGCYGGPGGLEGIRYREGNFPVRRRLSASTAGAEELERLKKRNLDLAISCAQYEKQQERDEETIAELRHQIAALPSPTKDQA